MTWAQVANVAMYGANWNSSYVKTVAQSSPEQGRRIALLNAAITFFFYCSEPGQLKDPSWSAPKAFNAGDVVFFTGQPTYFNGTQFTSYQKNGMSVAYIGNDNMTTLETAGCYTTADGDPAIDVVAIFAANIDQKLPNGYVPLAPNVTVPNNGSIACGSPNMLKLLESSAIHKLQDKGITVLLTFLNNHDAAGWSEFLTESDAARFVEQLQSVVTTYGLDGIDIDDEYTAGSPVKTSLAMVTSMMRTAMPDKIISKALFDDAPYFGVSYNGSTLEQSLTYGWEMSYGESPKLRLPPYVDAGMAKESLSLGFWSGQKSSNATADVEWVKKNGYAGVMAYAVEDAQDQALLGSLVDAWDGPGNWNKQAHCP